MGIFPMKITVCQKFARKWNITRILIFMYLPPKVEFPVETTPRTVRRRDVLERVIREDVDYGANHSRPVR